MKKNKKNIAHNAAVTLTHSTDMSQSIKDKVTFSDNKGNPLLKSTEDYENKIKELNKLQSSAEKSGNSDLADYYERLNNNVKHFKEEIVKNERELNQEVLAQKSDYISNIAHIIGENDKLTDSVKKQCGRFCCTIN